MSKNNVSTIEMGHFKFALIAPVIQGVFPDPSAAAYYRRVTANPLTLPDGKSVKYQPTTLERWTAHYRIGGRTLSGPNHVKTKAAPELSLMYPLKKPIDSRRNTTGLMPHRSTFASYRMAFFPLQFQLLPFNDSPKDKTLSRLAV
ncbi:MAG: hypothetical protein ACRC9L_06125 [Brevinema sp.]